MEEVRGLQINPQEIHGNWRAGYALDFYSVSFGRRTEIGTLVEQVKYYHDRSKVQSIAGIAAKFVKEEFTVNEHPVLPYLKTIIPMPPSYTTRPFQPVTEISKEIGRLLNRPIRTDYLTKIKWTEVLKNLSVESKRLEIQGAFAVQSQDLKVVVSCYLMMSMTQGQP